MKPEDEKTQEEKLEEQILELKNKIKNTEYDLEHMFKGNALVQQKLDNAKASLDEKQKLLNELSNNSETPQEQLDKIKQDITDKQTTPISKEQEKQIEEEIDTEFL